MIWNWLKKNTIYTERVCEEVLLEWDLSCHTWVTICTFGIDRNWLISFFSGPFAHLQWKLRSNLEISSDGYLFMCCTRCNFWGICTWLGCLHFYRFLCLFYCFFTAQEADFVFLYSTAFAMWLWLLVALQFLINDTNYRSIAMLLV